MLNAISNSILHALFNTMLNVTLNATLNSILNSMLIQISMECSTQHSMQCSMQHSIQYRHGFWASWVKFDLYFYSQVKCCLKSTQIFDSCLILTWNWVEFNLWVLILSPVWFLNFNFLIWVQFKLKIKIIRYMSRHVTLHCLPHSLADLFPGFLLVPCLLTSLVFYQHRGSSNSNNPYDVARGFINQKTLHQRMMILLLISFIRARIDLSISRINQYRFRELIHS